MPRSTKKTDAPAATAEAPKPGTQIKLPAMNTQRAIVRVTGNTPLIMHKFSDKARIQMLEKQQKRAKGPREARNLDQEFKDALYEVEPGIYGMPAQCFKKAMVRGFKHVTGVAMTDALGAFHVFAPEGNRMMGELIPLVDHSEPTPRQDVVRLDDGTAMVRVRPQFDTWAVDLAIEFHPDIVSIEQLLYGLQMAGFTCGIGDRRPQKEGNRFGQFKIESAQWASGA